MVDTLETSCVAPWPADEFSVPNYNAPRGACDTHAHVIARDSRFPLVSARSYTPPAASAEDYLAMLNATGMDRGVLVQVSVHGTDNRYMLETLADHPHRLRGVVVIDADISDAELERMHKAGVRGARFNLLFGGGSDLNNLEALDARLAPLGWHLEFLLDGRDLTNLRKRLIRLRCPVVIDHMGHIPVTDGAAPAAFKKLLALVQEYDWWVKLSGVYRISQQHNTAFRDVMPWAHALIDAAPDRMLYGSDWPHVDQTQMVDTGLVRNLLSEWAPSADLRQAILVDNPARLYRFPTYD